MKRSLSIFVSIVFLLARPAFAQTDLTNTGTLKVSGSTDTLYVTGNFTNNSGSAFTNNGKFYVKQNLTNNEASMTAGTGTLYLNGSSTQTVGGAQIFKTYDFVSNNSSGITLNNDLSVAGTHTFTAGLITTSSTPNYLVYIAGSSYTGDGDSKHVNGWVKKFGSTDFTFPVGDATYERTAGLVNLSASSEFNCKYSRSTTNINNLQSPVVMVDTAEYWDINEVSGGTAQIALNWNAAKVPFPHALLSDIIASDYSSSLWTNAGGTATGNVTTTGNITSNAKSSFSPFTFGFTSITLPLKIISFTAQKRTGYVQLHWITANEQNVSHFEIQRSDDGTHFFIIGTVAARNISSQQQYDFEDHAPLSGVRFYRIRSLDIDGKYSYSGIVAVTENDPGGGSLFTVANPVHNGIALFNKTGQGGSFDYRLFNAAGQTIQAGNLNLPINSSAAFALSPSVIPGVYVLEISKGAILFRQKIMVE